MAASASGWSVLTTAVSAEEIVSSYRQLQEVERAFRALKSLVKVRPMFH